MKHYIVSNIYLISKRKMFFQIIVSVSLLCLTSFLWKRWMNNKSIKRHILFTDPWMRMPTGDVDDILAIIYASIIWKSSLQVVICEDKNGNRLFHFMTEWGSKLILLFGINVLSETDLSVKYLNDSILHLHAPITKTHWI